MMNIEKDSLQGMGMLKWMIGSLLLLTLCVQAVPKVVVVGLFQGRALIEIEGQQTLMREGEEKQGVTLVSATSKQAVLMMDGVESTHQLGGQIGGTFSKPEFKQETIWANTRGEFHTVGQINGQPVSMLLDTGATFVALNSHTADRIGLSYKNNPSGTVSTASGLARAYQVRLDHIILGSIKIYGVTAVVLEGGFPQTVLLGMSFLGRVEMEKSGQGMTLRSR